jgi:hypothetical protein
MPNRAGVALVLAMLAYGGLQVMRIGPLFLLAALMLTSPVLARRWPLAPASSVSRRTMAENLVGVMMVAIPAFVALRVGAFALGCIPPLPGARVDPAPVVSLKAAEPGRLVTSFNWGEYAIWHLGPRLLVSIDGRRETVYSAARLADDQAIVTGQPSGLAVLDDWRAEYIWLPVSSETTRAWLAENGYRIDIQTARSFVAVRDDLPRLPRLREVAVAQTPCFPN